MAKNYYKSMASTPFSRNRLISSVSHAALAAGGFGLAVTLMSYTGLLPTILNSRVKAAFGIAAYALLFGIVTYRSYGTRPSPQPPDHRL